MKSSHRPVITLALLAINLIAAFAVVLNPGWIDEYGFSRTRPLFAISSLFLHANAMHLLGNLIFLAAVGVAVEIATGSIRFLTTYIAAGLAGCLAYAVATASIQPPPSIIGASSAIAGCVAYYAARYNALRVAIAPKVSASVLAVTGVWLLLQVLGVFIQIGGEVGGTSFISHLGGFAMGLVLSVVMRVPDLGERQLGHEVLDAMNHRGPDALIMAAEQHLARHPDDIEAVQKLLKAYKSLGDVQNERRILLAHLESAPKSAIPPMVERLLEISNLGDFPSRQRLKIAAQIRQDHPKAAELLAKSVLQATDDPERPEAIFALADWRPEQRSELVRILVNEYPMHAALERAKHKGWL